MNISKVNIGNHSYPTVSVDSESSPTWQASEYYSPLVREHQYHADMLEYELQENRRIQENLEAKRVAEYNFMAYLTPINMEQPDEGITPNVAYALIEAFKSGMATVSSLYNMNFDKRAAESNVEQKPAKMEYAN